MYKMNCRCGHTWENEINFLECSECGGPARDIGFAFFDSPVSSTKAEAEKVMSGKIVSSDLNLDSTTDATVIPKEVKKAAAKKYLVLGQ